MFLKLLFLNHISCFFLISEASHIWIPSPVTQLENLQSPDDGKTLGRIEPAGTLLGTDISQPKGLFEDDVPFLKVGYVSVPWRVTMTGCRQQLLVDIVSPSYENALSDEYSYLLWRCIYLQACCIYMYVHYSCHVHACFNIFGQISY